MMKRRAFTLLLACIFLFCLFPTPQANAFYSNTDIPYEVEGGNIYFNQSTGEITYVDPDATKAVIPEEIEGTAVVGIDSFAFAGSKIQSVSIPDSVKYIDDRAFDGCTELTEIQLGNGLESISPTAFANCAYSDSEENWENDVLYIDGCLILARQSVSGEYSVRPGTYLIASRAFKSCSLLEKIILPEELVCIDSEAFYQCTGLLEITIPDSVSKIGAEAFSGCSAMETIVIGDQIQRICNGAFVGTAYYEDASNWKNGLLIIDQYLIRADKEIVDIVTVPSGTVLIADGAFSLCAQMSEVVISDDVRSIGAGAFSWCSNLQRVTLPKELKEISDNLFNRCGYLWEIQLPSGVQSVGDHAFANCEGLTRITIPEQVSSIGQGAFSECMNLRTVTLSGKLQTIGAYAFENCDALVSVNIPQNVETVGVYAFQDCDSLEEVMFGRNVAQIGEHAFYSCEALKAAYFYGDAPYVGEAAFKYYFLGTFEDIPLPELTLFYPEGKSGWTTPTWNGYPTAVWVPNPFDDVPEDAWYAYAVSYAVRNGLFNGMSETTFEPDTAMTRAMLVTVLWRYAGAPAEGENTFTDVPAGQWYTDAVAWAAHNSIVGGVGDNKFDPNGNVTREQMATILYRYASGQGIDTSARADLSAFPDAGSVSSYAQDPICWAVAEGLINGSDGKLLPQGNATRAQVATILMRFIENVVK